VEIVFRNERMKNECNDSKQCARAYGPARARLIRRRLDQLAAARNLEDCRNLGGRYHELRGDRAGELAADLDGAWRLIFEPMEQPPPRKPDGGLDWRAVTAIRIVGVENYHD